MAPPAPHDGDTPYDLHRFLADLRRTGTGISGPVPGEPDTPWVEDERFDALLDALAGEARAS